MPSYLIRRSHGFPRRLAGSARWLLACVLLVGLGAVGCEDKEKVAKQQVGKLLARLAPLIERDTKQVREGLPKGAEKLASLVDDEPGADLAGLQRAIKRARADVESLAFAKSTFFLFVGADGTVLRSETDPDLPAGKSLYEAVPETKKLSDPSTGLFETYGSMHELRGAEKGADQQWIVGHPVKSGEGEVVGSFVTGWSLRKYAEYLEEDTRRHLTKTLADEAKSISLVYLFVVVGGEAYGAPVTPEVNAEAIGKLGVVSKAKNDELPTTIDVDGRSFVVDAEVFEQMGDDVAVAIMYSPV